jgi:hypothetical protein
MHDAKLFSTPSAAVQQIPALFIGRTPIFPRQKNLTACFAFSGNTGFAAMAGHW